VLQVVVLPPEDAMRGIEEFRRLHDPAFHRVAAHLSLVPPFHSDDRGLVSRLERVPLPPSFDVLLGPPSPIGRALALPVVSGEAPLDALRRATAAALFPREELPPALPGLRVGFFGSRAEMELARRAILTVAPPPPFPVSCVSLLVEDQRGLWHEVVTRRLPRRS
jgi:2'-5' RNA ligase superfamily protein